MSEHPSRLRLEALRLGELSEEEAAEVRAHIASDDALGEMVAEADAQDAWFLEQFPSALDLEAAVAVPSPAEHHHPEPPSAPRLRHAWWAIGAGIAAAAAVLLFAVPAEVPSSSEARPPLHASNLRAKGASALDVTVRRGTERFRLEQQPLRPGDVLTFRYTSARTHLTLVGTEEGTGKVSVYVARAITPGADVALTEGVALDNYIGRETLVAYFTNTPLDPAMFSAPPAEGSKGGAATDAETVSITITKVRR